MIFTESVEFRNSVYITRIAYSGEIINTCAYNVYQSLCASVFIEPGDEASVVYWE